MIYWCDNDASVDVELWLQVGISIESYMTDSHEKHSTLLYRLWFCDVDYFVLSLSVHASLGLLFKELNSRTSDNMIIFRTRFPSKTLKYFLLVFCMNVLLCM